MRPFTQFQSKIRATKVQKSAIFFLIYSYFSDIFIMVKIWYQIISSLVQNIFLETSPAKIWLLLAIGAVNKNTKGKRKVFKQSWT